MPIRIQALYVSHLAIVGSLDREIWTTLFIKNGLLFDIKN